MTEILKEALVSRPAEVLFDLVSDIAAYPHFLPGCPKVEIHHQTETETEATLFVQKGWVKFSFRTRNKNERPGSIPLEDQDAGFLTTSFISHREISEARHNKVSEGYITMELVEGPFRALTGKWTFTPLNNDACKVSFRLNYEFSQRAFQMTLNPAMEKLAETFVTAFVERAQA